MKCFFNLKIQSLFGYDVYFYSVHIIYYYTAEANLKNPPNGFFLLN